MLMALKGHFLTHIPQPLQSVSDMTALFPSTLMASTLLRTIGQKLTQTWLHFLTLHLSSLSTAIRVIGNVHNKIKLVSYKFKTQKEVITRNP
jgi:hypothetical protein